MLRNDGKSEQSRQPRRLRFSRYASLCVQYTFPLKLMLYRHPRPENAPPEHHAPPYHVLLPHTPHRLLPLTRRAPRNTLLANRNPPPRLSPAHRRFLSRILMDPPTRIRPQTRLRKRSPRRSKGSQNLASRSRPYRLIPTSPIHFFDCRPGQRCSGRIRAGDRVRGGVVRGVRCQRWSG